MSYQEVLELDQESRSRSRRGSGDWLLGILGLGVLALLTLGPVGSPATPSSHAVERHGTDAQAALAMVQRGGDCRVCVDGRVRCTASQGGQWAVVVYQIINGDWKTLTSFLCDQDYANSVKDNCDPTWRAIHP